MRSVKAFMQLVACDLAPFLLLELGKLCKQLLLQSLHLVFVSLHALDVCVEKVVWLRLREFLLDLVHQRAHHLGILRLLRLLRVDALWRWRGLIFGGVAGELHDGLEDELIGRGRRIFMLLEGFEKLVDAGEQSVIDYALIFQGLDLVAALLSLLMDLSLLGSNERTFVDVGVDLDVRVIGQFQRIPFAVVEHHLDVVAILFR